MADQPSAQNALEIYEDEWGTYWVPFFNVSATEAKRRVREAYGETRLRASVVRGRVVNSNGEPEFELDPAGPDVMWEVVARG